MKSMIVVKPHTQDSWMQKSGREIFPWCTTDSMCFREQRQCLLTECWRLAVTEARSLDKRTQTMQKIPCLRYMGSKGGYYWAAEIKIITRSEVRTKLFLFLSQHQLRLKETFYSPLQHEEWFASQAYLGQGGANLGGSGSTSVSVERFRTQVTVAFTSADPPNPSRPHPALHFLSPTQSSVPYPSLSFQFGCLDGHPAFIWSW